MGVSTSAPAEYTTKYGYRWLHTIRNVQQRAMSAEPSQSRQIHDDARQAGDEQNATYFNIPIYYFTSSTVLLNVVAWERKPGKVIPYTLPWARTLCPALNLIFGLFRHLAPQSTTIIFPILLHTVRTHRSRRRRPQRAHCFSSNTPRFLDFIYSMYISASSTRLCRVWWLRTWSLTTPSFVDA